jgi:hypothetical protein
VQGRTWEECKHSFLVQISHPYFHPFSSSFTQFSSDNYGSCHTWALVTHLSIRDFIQNCFWFFFCAQGGTIANRECKHSFLVLLN